MNSVSILMKKEIAFELNIIMASPKEYTLEQTEETVNAFSCKINGEIFNPGTLPKGSPALYGGYSNNFTIVRITAKSTETKPYKYVIIELNNFQGKGDYDLSDTNNDCRYEEFYPDNTYKSTLSKMGIVTITTDDRINFILSGRFEFTAVNTTNPLENIIISQGHFHLQF